MHTILYTYSLTLCQLLHSCLFIQYFLLELLFYICIHLLSSFYVYTRMYLYFRLFLVLQKKKTWSFTIKVLHSFNIRLLHFILTTMSNIYHNVYASLKSMGKYSAILILCVHSYINVYIYIQVRSCLLEENNRNFLLVKSYISIILDYCDLWITLYYIRSTTSTFALKS